MHRLTTWAEPIMGQALILWGLLCLVGIPLYFLVRRRSWNPLSHRSDLRFFRLPPLVWVVLCLAYFSGIIAFTFLPLPSRSTYVCHDLLYFTRYFAGWSVPFAFNNTPGMGLHRFLSWWFVQIYLNVLLFVPWGLIGRAVFRWRFRTALLSAFFMSLFIEVSQLTGIWGYFGCRYRTFDVDDILTNTLGGVIGFFFVVLVECFRYGKRRAELAPIL